MLIKILLIIFTYILLLLNHSFADWATVIFNKPSGKNIGFAEGVDSWFLNAPAFKFNLKNIEPGEYRLALYDGKNCNEYGVSAEINRPELKDWNPSKLLIFTVKENRIYNVTLGMKPKKFTDETVGLITIGSLRGHPLIIFKKNINTPFACGIVPIN